MPGRRVLAGSALAAGTAGLGVRQVLTAQSASADRKIRPLVGVAPPVRERYGNPDDPPFTLALLGDSSAQGVGVEDFDQTLGGWLGRHLAGDGWQVQVVCVAANGSRAEHLAAQRAELARAASAPPDLVVISTGANDVRARTNPRRAAADLGAAVAALRAHTIAVAVGTTPYLGIIEALEVPLRQLAQVASRRLERAQVAAVTAAGGVPVPLGALLAPMFVADPTLFARDGFHPSARGYALIGAQVLTALGPALLSRT